MNSGPGHPSGQNVWFGCNLFWNDLGMILVWGWFWGWSGVILGIFWDAFEILDDLGMILEWWFEGDDLILKWFWGWWWFGGDDFGWMILGWLWIWWFLDGFGWLGERWFWMFRFWRFCDEGLFGFGDFGMDFGMIWEWFWGDDFGIFVEWRFFG